MKRRNLGDGSEFDSGVTRSLIPDTLRLAPAGFAALGALAVSADPFAPLFLPLRAPPLRRPRRGCALSTLGMRHQRRGHVWGAAGAGIGWIQLLSPLPHLSRPSIAGLLRRRRRRRVDAHTPGTEGVGR